MQIKLKDRLFPKDSKIRYYFVLIKQTVQTLKNSGIKETIKKTTAGVCYSLGSIQGDI